MGMDMTTTHEGEEHYFRSAYNVYGVLQLVEFARPGLVDEATVYDWIEFRDDDGEIVHSMPGIPRDSCERLAAEIETIKATPELVKKYLAEREPTFAERLAATFNAQSDEAHDGEIAITELTEMREAAAMLGLAPPPGREEMPAHFAQRLEGLAEFLHIAAKGSGVMMDG